MIGVIRDEQKSAVCGSLSSISKPLLPCRLLLLCWAVFKKFSVGVFLPGKDLRTDSSDEIAGAKKKEFITAI